MQSRGDVNVDDHSVALPPDQPWGLDYLLFEGVLPILTLCVLAAHDASAPRPCASGR